MHAIFTRKTDDITDACFGGRPQPIEVQARREMTTAEYDGFTRSMQLSRSWLLGNGGLRDGKTLVIEVTAPERKTLYINPEGSNYARYVGIEW